MAASDQRHAGLGCLGVIVNCGLVGFCAMQIIDVETEMAIEKSTRICSDKRRNLALVISRTFIKRQLKAPATAEFPWLTSDGVNVPHGRMSVCDPRLCRCREQHRRKTPHALIRHCRISAGIGKLGITDGLLAFYWTNRS